MGERVEKQPLLTLIHGRHFGEWHWRSLQAELRALGWISIAPNLNVENANLSLEDHARHVETEESATGAEEVIRVPHSWGANVALRSATSHPRVRSIINVASVFYPSSFPDIPAANFPRLAHSAAYETLKRKPDSFRGMADIVFFNDIHDPDLMSDAIEALRDHPRREYEPPIKEPLEIPMSYIRTTRDCTVTKACQGEMAQLIGVQKPEDLESGHAPMLSQPQKLAQKIVELANEAIRMPPPSA